MLLTNQQAAELTEPSIGSLHDPSAFVASYLAPVFIPPPLVVPPVGAINEEQVRGKPPDLRCSVRQAQSKPILDDLHQWMEKMLRSLSAKSDTAAAIRYALSH